MDGLGAVHRRELEVWRQAMNLVGPGPIQDHFDDCLSAFEGLGEHPRGRWVDLGSGAGFPGLVFADQYPEAAVDLVESRKKRAAFLRHVVTTAAASNVRVLSVRAETLVGPYEGVLSRAFAPPPVVLDHARRILAPGGQLVWFLSDGMVLPETQDFERVWSRAYAVGSLRRFAAGWKRILV